MGAEQLDSPTQFAWACLGHALPAAADDALCRICGGPAGPDATPFEAAVPPTFANPNVLPCPQSPVVCPACVALVGRDAKATWDAYVAAHPEAGLKTGRSMSWRSYSHAFWPGYHEAPKRERWRDLLVDPPEPPFLFVLSETAQKHLLFRAAVAQSRAWYPLQVEEDRVWIDLAAFREVLEAFEDLLALGFSREQVATGRYHHGQLLKVGLRRWRVAEGRFAPQRAMYPEYVRVCQLIARKREDADDDRDDGHDTQPAAAEPVYAQESLFAHR